MSEAELTLARSRLPAEALRFSAGLYLFLLALDGFKLSWRLLFSVDQATTLVLSNVTQMLDNPLLGFFLGILVTSLIQSSSATIAIIISFVAVQQAPVAVCIPMILGANIGTTVTNTLVGLGHAFQREEFRRIVPAALIDDVFKCFNVGLFFALELLFGVLTRLSEFVVTTFGQLSSKGSGQPLLPDFIDALTHPVMSVWSDAAAASEAGVLIPLVSMLVAFALLLAGLRFMGAAMQHLFSTRARSLIQTNLQNPLRGSLIGFACCWVLQSSSVTTSLMIPLVAQRVATLRNTYYVSIGAAVGTTADAGQILAYLKYGVAGLAAGIVHITVNVVGAVLFLSVPVLRELPVKTATAIGRQLEKTRYAPLVFGFAVLLLFYGLPLAMFLLL